MAWCNFHEQRGWAQDYCLKKDDFIDSETAKKYCCYGGKDCPIFENSSSSNGCYLTTACVEHKGLPDDCMELSTLREFRDSYLAATEDGKAEIQEYYRTAPQIVKAINKSNDADVIYERLYSDVILKCVELIHSGSNEEAHKKYRDMVSMLKRKYCEGD